MEQTLYEVINKETDEVIAVVRSDNDMNPDTLTVGLPEGDVIEFTKTGFFNESYEIRERGSKLSPVFGQFPVREDLDSVVPEEEGGQAEEVEETE